MYYNTEDLIASVKRRTLMPDGIKTFQDSDLISLLNEELQGSLVPDLLLIREDFFLQTSTTALVAGLSVYPISERAIGNSLKSVALQYGTEIVPLRRISYEDAQVQSARSGVPSAFAIKGDEVLLVPTPSLSSGSLLLSFFARPNQLVQTADCALITDITDNGSTVTFTVNTDLSSALVTGSAVDFLNAQSPFLLWAEDVEIVAINTTTIEVDKESIADGGGNVMPAVNDYICQALRANIPMVPQEAHPILAQMCAARVLEAMKDANGLQMVNVKLGEMRKQFLSVISNRVETEARSVVPRNGIYRYLTRR